MKNLILSLAVSAILVSCSSTKITGAWKSPQLPARMYGNVFVASLSSNNVARATVENDMALALEKQGIKVYKSMDEFPPGVKKDSVTKEDILSSMKNRKAESILTVSLVRKETESRYVRDAGIPYTPFQAYPYYSDFGGYYTHWQPYIYTPGYYEQTKTYYIETNLYDSATEKLVWSAQSKTYNPTDLNAFSKEFSRIIITKLKEDGMLKPGVVLSSGE